jgi:hypothetical protein
MELDITRFFTEACPMDYSASVAEIGKNAGPDTWRAACADAGEYNLLPDDDARQEFRDYVKTFGAWTVDEIAAWSNDELNALCIQMISGDIREGDLDTEEPDWEEYERQSEAGRVAGRIFKGVDGKVYYYIGS